MVAKKHNVTIRTQEMVTLAGLIFLMYIAYMGYGLYDHIFSLLMAVLAFVLYALEENAFSD